jgi:serine/threonine-protein kinase
MELRYAQFSAPGRHRAINQDCLGYWQPLTPDEWMVRGAIAILADGVGSLARGEEASRSAVEAGLNAFRQSSVGGQVKQLVTEAGRAANWAVYTAALNSVPPARMGTTLALAVFCRDEVLVGNVGDTRVYHVRGHRARQLSVDHSVTGAQRQYGLITDDQARRSHERHIITRSLGQEPEVAMDTSSAMLAPTDRVVLCTDGLYSLVNDRELAEIVSNAAPLDACRRLVALAQHRGGDDDISVQVIEIIALGQPAASPDSTASFIAAVESGDADPQPGHTLDNRFLLTDVVARSGMATLFQAIDLDSYSTVAVKIPFAQYRARLQHEADILRKLTHPYILRFIADKAGKHVAYLVTEYLRGYTLGHLMRNICPLPETEARKIGSRLCEALAQVHEQGYLHRDIKPQNIMLCSDDTLRLMDFGLATTIQQHVSFLHRFGPRVGTADYMAPEQVQGKACDGRADLFSLGVVLYEMLTGKMPFAGQTPKEVMSARLCEDPVPVRQRNETVSVKLEAVVRRALARNPADRYPDAAALRLELLG